MNSGVYQILSPSGNCYVGSTKDFKGRWRRHKNQLKKGKHPNQILQNACNKYGFNTLEFIIIATCPIDYLEKLEQYFIDNFKPKYNRSKSAVNPMFNENIRIKHRESVLEAVENRGDEWLANLRLAAKNRSKPTLTKSQRKERSRQVKERMTEEHKKYLSEKLTKLKTSKPVRCIETGMVFSSVKKAAKYLNKVGSHSNIRNACVGKLKSAYGFTWEYVD